MRSASCVAAAIALAIAACGPTAPGNGDRDGGGDDDRDGGTDEGVDGGRIDARPRYDAPPGLQVSGTVWAPGNAPGMVPRGHEIPIYGAAVYLTQGAVSPIQDGAFCDMCQEAPAGAVISDAKGKFTIQNVYPGSYTLVVQKAQFRIETPVDVVPGDPIVLPDEATTLPSKHDQAHGKWIPRIALVVTNSDRIEDVLGKMGFVDVDGSGRVVESSFARNDHLDLYAGYTELPPFGPAPYPSKHKGTIDQLFGDLTRMKRYHVIIVPCTYIEDLGGIARADIRNNIRAYVADGGKLYVTDWAGEWEDAVFPEFIKYAVGLDTDAASAAAGIFNPVNGDYGHFALHAAAEDPNMRSWLDGQKGPIVEPTGGEENDYHGTYTQGTIDGGDFVIEGIWTLIESLGTVRTGTDPATGDPIMNTPKQWVSGDYNGARSPHTVTFEPSCGRVMYSTYHTANEVHVGLVPQERVLLYLLMEIGVCFDIPDIDE